MTRFNLRVILFLIFPAAFSIISCSKKGNSPTPPQTADTARLAKWPANADIYFAGTAEGANTKGYLVATIWKNGIPTILDNPLGNNDPSNSAKVSGIAVHNTNVYVVGSIGIGQHDAAIYWVNGVEKRLSATPGFSKANAVAIDGNDVYMVGVVNNNATFWKNGQEITLSSLSSEATAIVISGKDIYIAGNSYDKYQSAALWKNGKRVELDTDVLAVGSYATAVSVSGSDVYMGGGINSKGATTWKNGVSTVLFDGKNDISSTVTDIAVKAGDIYAAGRILNKVTLWKNGRATTMPFNDKNYLVNKISIGFNGDDLYLFSGLANVDNTDAVRAIFWQNNVAYQFNSKIGVVNGLAVANH